MGKNENKDNNDNNTVATEMDDYIGTLIDQTIKVPIIVKHREPQFAYVISRFSGDVEKNLINAGAYCQMLMRGAVPHDERYYLVPIASHIMYPNMGLSDKDKIDRALGRIYGLNLLKLCNSVYVFINSYEKPSDGMNAEIHFALKLKLPIYTIYVKEVDGKIEIVDMHTGIPEGYNYGC